MQGTARGRPRLVRFLGDLDLGEEAGRDASTIAVRTCPETGVPPSPADRV
ncbi:hypothetical protein ABZ079_14965 [Streptomyces sp. NPDC006314]